MSKKSQKLTNQEIGLKSNNQWNNGQSLDVWHKIGKKTQKYQLRKIKNSKIWAKKGQKSKNEPRNGQNSTQKMAKVQKLSQKMNKVRKIGPISAKNRKLSPKKLSKSEKLVHNCPKIDNESKIGPKTNRPN